MDSAHSQRPVSKLSHLPPRPAAAHKGTFGTVIVVGGCPTMIGAPALAATAALRSGAGLVKVAAQAAIIPHVLTIQPSATGIALPNPGNADALAGAVAAIDEADPQQRAVLAIGPGLSAADHVQPLVLALLNGPRNVVLDADGLNALARHKGPRPGRCPLVLTPHPGEFRRLADPLGIHLAGNDIDDRRAAAAQLARAHQAVVVLKGAGTIVCDARPEHTGRWYFNTTGNPALATAGTGDVLTGLIASLIAQGLDPFDAAALAVCLHGRAADLWAVDSGPRGLTALDLANLLPAAMLSHEARTRDLH